MRKLLFLLFTLLALQTAHAQSKVGIKFSPTLSTNRINDVSNGVSYSSNGVGGRFIFGPVVDLFITENYYFSTGLLYVPKRVGITITEPGSPTIEEAYRLQYLQIPATLKLFTNELALDTRVYFQLGGLFELKISDKPSEETYVNVEGFRLFDLGVHLGTGVEYRVGYNTLLFGGLYYNRGLINVVTKTIGNADINIKNDLLGLELGVKF
ncbi:porin family protein [Nafulsella turpanensis]|uniref:porin family protein n=1 Tax=Nafulsella turpanensis TaxID=1265690 RepID=UPI0003494E55|nr:porin family protein [Nafulsella turpanensis]